MQIDAFRLRHVAECVEKQPNGSAILDELFRRTKLSRKAISLDKTVDVLKEPEFITEACDILQDPVFAARAGLSLRDGTNLTSYIAKYSPTLRAAIENSSRYYSIFDPAFSYSLRVSGNAASFEVDCRDPEYFQFHRHKEFLLFAALSRARSRSTYPTGVSTASGFTGGLIARWSPRPSGSPGPSRSPGRSASTGGRPPGR